jgi:hypothetical protein
VIKIAHKELINSLQVANLETGEVYIQETINRLPGQIIAVIDPKIKPLQTQDEVAQKREQKHIKLRSARDQKRIYKSLAENEKAFLFSLLPYMDWESNILMGDGEDGENGKPLRWSHVEKIAGISKPTRLKIVKELEIKRIIGYMVVGGSKKGIVVNPEYALYGHHPMESLLATFQASKDIDYED